MKAIYTWDNGNKTKIVKEVTGLYSCGHVQSPDGKFYPRISIESRTDDYGLDCVLCVLLEGTSLLVIPD